MRLYFYCLAAVCAALIGWNLGQFVLEDLGLLTNLPELVLFPCISASLAVGIVTNEVLISNPTRPKINFRILKSCLLIAVALGVGIGLLAGGLVQLLFIPSLSIPSFIIRVTGWIVIGIAVGLAEGLTWQRRSIEAGNAKRSRRRIFASVICAMLASGIAALLFEIIRILGTGTLPQTVRNLEDPIGFSILGLLLGIVFSITSSPSYMAALRAGSGFEYRKIEPDAIDTVGIETSALSFPYISQSSNLDFVGAKEDSIEEGMSIQLPARGKIRIGSATKREPDIYLPGVALHVADLDIYPRHAVLDPNQKVFDTIEVNGVPLKSRRPVILKHNSLLTFHALDSSNDPYAKKLYRLVYYNRFLDPQA